MFSDFNSRLFTHFSLLYLPISFRFVFFCLLFFSKKHTVCFLTSNLAFSHTFLLCTCQSASGMGFPACFSLPTPTPWVFPLVFYSPRPVSAPRHIDQLPGWVFLLAFLFLRPRHGFSRLFSYFPHPLFSPLPAYQLPGWVFSLDFIFPNPRHGLSGLDPYFHTHFSPHHLPACFWHSFSRSLSSSYS